jgi:hypothetical protein
MHPPIIWVCQKARITQYAFYRYIWCVVAVAFLWALRHGAVWITVGNIIHSCWRAVDAGTAPNFWVHPLGVIRAVMVGCLVLNIVVQSLLGHLLDWSTIILVLAVAAEYAATISTIPPLMKRADRTAADQGA